MTTKLSAAIKQLNQILNINFATSIGIPTKEYLNNPVKIIQLKLDNNHTIDQQILANPNELIVLTYDSNQLDVDKETSQHELEEDMLFTLINHLINNVITSDYQDSNEATNSFAIADFEIKVLFNTLIENYQNEPLATLCELDDVMEYLNLNENVDRNNFCDKQTLNFSVFQKLLNDSAKLFQPEELNVTNLDKQDIIHYLKNRLTNNNLDDIQTPASLTQFAQLSIYEFLLAKLAEQNGQDKVFTKVLNQPNNVTESDIMTLTDLVINETIFSYPKYLWAMIKDNQARNELPNERS